MSMQSENSNRRQMVSDNFLSLNVNQKNTRNDSQMSNYNSQNRKEN